MRFDLLDRVGGVGGGPLDDHVELGEVRESGGLWLWRGGGRWYLLVRMGVCVVGGCVWLRAGLRGGSYDAWCTVRRA
jgi:hypothetical protein